MSGELGGEGLLIGIAEVAAAFAGFSSVVAIFGSRSAREWSPAERFRLTNLLVMALACALFAFVPRLLSLLGLAPESAWRAASSLLLAFHVGTNVWSARGVRRIGLGGGARLRLWMAIFYLLSFAAIVMLQLVNLFGSAIGPGPGPYAAALFLMLVVAALQFAFLVLDPLARDGE